MNGSRLNSDPAVVECVEVEVRGQRSVFWGYGSCLCSHTLSSQILPVIYTGMIHGFMAQLVCITYCIHFSIPVIFLFCFMSYVVIRHLRL